MEDKKYIWRKLDHGVEYGAEFDSVDACIEDAKARKGMELETKIVVGELQKFEYYVDACIDIDVIKGDLVQIFEHYIEKKELKMEQIDELFDLSEDEFVELSNRMTATMREYLIEIGREPNFEEFPPIIVDTEIVELKR